MKNVLMNKPAYYFKIVCLINYPVIALTLLPAHANVKRIILN